MFGTGTNWACPGLTRTWVSGYAPSPPELESSPQLCNFTVACTLPSAGALSQDTPRMPEIMDSTKLYTVVFPIHPHL